MKKFALLVSAAAVLAVPATPAPAATTDGPIECVQGAVKAVQYILQGTPQPQECNLT